MAVPCPRAIIEKVAEVKDHECDNEDGDESCDGCSCYEPEQGCGAEDCCKK